MDSGRGNFSPRWVDAIISDASTIRDAIRCLNQSGLLLCCIQNLCKKLIGVVSDGDIRKALLNGAELDAPVLKVANRNPVLGSIHSSAAELSELARRSGKREIPLIDEDGKLRDFFVLGLREQRTTDPQPLSCLSDALLNPVLILAGGLGTRLRSIVSDRPKSLAEIGGRPILEIVMSRLMASGLSNFFVAVNYMAEQVEAHFQASQYSAAQINFVREKDRLGTAGAIGLIKNHVSQPLLVCNADVLTTVPFERILNTHKSECADITCVVRPHIVSVPYGVIEIERGLITGVREKPELSYFVNAGIYVLSPEICHQVIEDEYLDMPSLITRAMADGRRVVPFLLHEYWIDIGQPDDYRKANSDAASILGDI